MEPFLLTFLGSLDEKFILGHDTLLFQYRENPIIYTIMFITINISLVLCKITIHSEYKISVGNAKYCMLIAWFLSLTTLIVFKILQKEKWFNYLYICMGFLHLNGIFWLHFKSSPLFSSYSWLAVIKARIH